jgi:hypothetical protein
MCGSFHLRSPWYSAARSNYVFKPKEIQDIIITDALFMPLYLKTTQLRMSLMCKNI